MRYFYKNLLINSSILFITIFLCLAAAEVISRIFVPNGVLRDKEWRTYSAMIRSDPVFRRVLVPNYKGRVIGKGIDFSVDINSKGLRDREFPYEKKDGVYRILFVGDSFIFGYGLEQEQSIPKLLEQKLRVYYEKKNIEVINAGITGWGSSQELDFIKLEAAKYKPNAIIFGFFLNDVEDTFSITSGFEDNIISWEKTRANRLRTFFSEWSYFYLFLEDKFRILKRKITATTINFSIPKSTEKPQDPAMVAKEPWSYTNLYSNWDAFAEKFWELTMRDLLEMNRISSAICAKTMFVYLPDQFVAGRVKLDGMVNMEKPDQVFSDFMRKNKLHSVNLVPMFKKSSLPELYIFDGHFNDAGSHLAAEEIFLGIRNNEIGAQLNIGSLGRGTPSPCGYKTP